MCVSLLSCFNHAQLFATLWTVACQTPLSMGFSRQEYWSGLPYLPPGDLPNPGIEPMSLMFNLQWEAGSLPIMPPRNPNKCVQFSSVQFSSVTQSCPTLCNVMDCSLPGSSVHGTLQARILEWVAIPSSRGSSQPMNQTQVSHTAGRFFTI